MGSNRRPPLDGPDKELIMPKKNTVSIDLVIAKYVETRDELEAKKKAFDLEVMDLKAVQEKRELWLKGEMDRLGVDSFKTAAGTAFVDYKDSATVSDPVEFFDWVISDWDARKCFLENRVSKAAVKMQLDNGEVPPPGVNYVKVKDVKVRRPSK